MKLQPLVSLLEVARINRMREMTFRELVADGAVPLPDFHCDRYLFYRPGSLPKVAKAVARITAAKLK